METLVLSPHFEPMNQVSWVTALTLAFLGKVEVLEEYEDWTVRSVSCEFQVPAVIRFVQGAGHWRRRTLKLSRNNLYRRDQGRCQYCSVHCTRADFTFDHVVPRARGGRTTWENIVVACIDCNQKKGARTPAEASMKLKRKPSRPTTAQAIARLTVPCGKVPKQWLTYLRSDQYWNAPLAED